MPHQHNHTSIHPEMTAFNVHMTQKVVFVTSPSLSQALFSSWLGSDDIAPGISTNLETSSSLTVLLSLWEIRPQIGFLTKLSLSKANVVVFLSESEPEPADSCAWDELIQTVAPSPIVLHIRVSSQAAISPPHVTKKLSLPNCISPGIVSFSVSDVSQIKSCLSALFDFLIHRSQQTPSLDQCAVTGS